MPIGIRIHANLHKLYAKVEPDLNGFVLKLEIGGDYIEVQATAEQVEGVANACLNGLKADAGGQQ